MVFAHTVLGATATYCIVNRNKFSKIEKSIIYFTGIIGATFPDFDILLMLIFPNTHHRYFLTHSIIPYSIFFLIMVLLLKKSDKYLKITNAAFFLGVLTHLFSDLMIGGLVLLAPFSDYYFGYKITSIGNRLNWALDYMQSRYFLFELTLFAPFIVLWKKEKDVVFRHFPIFWTFIAAFMLGALIFFE